MIHRCGVASCSAAASRYAALHSLPSTTPALCRCTQPSTNLSQSRKQYISALPIIVPIWLSSYHNNASILPNLPPRHYAITLRPFPFIPSVTAPRAPDLPTLWQPPEEAQDIDRCLANNFPIDQCPSPCLISNTPVRIALRKFPSQASYAQVGRVGSFSLLHGTVHATSHKADAICLTFPPPKSHSGAHLCQSYPSSLLLLFASADTLSPYLFQAT